MQARSARAVINSSASHVFDVLRFICTWPVPLGVTEISRQLKLPASTVYRALITLEEADYIRRYRNTPRFELAPTPHLLNRALFSRFELHHASRPLMRSLAQATGETVSLWARLGWFALRIGGAFGSRDVYHRARLGETRLLHEGAAASVILAELSEADLASYRRFVDKHFPERRPDAGWDAQAQDLRLVRTRGFATIPLPMAPGFDAVAIPIRNESGHPVASIMLDGPVLRSGEAELDPCALQARDDLEVMIALDPAAFLSPFAHIPADGLLIRTPSTSDTETGGSG